MQWCLLQEEFNFQNDFIRKKKYLYFIKDLCTYKHIDIDNCIVELNSDQMLLINISIELYLQRTPHRNKKDAQVRLILISNMSDQEIQMPPPSV